MGNNSVCVLGGTGFVGRHLVARLAAAGRNVKVLTRRRERQRSGLVCPTVDLVECNVHEPADLDRQFAAAGSVVFLPGILNETGNATFKRVHVELVRTVSEACIRNGVRRLLHMSALNASAAAGASEYLRTKGEGEDIAHLAGGKVAVTSFRPSVIFGPDDSFFNRFADLLKLGPVMPLACPNARFKPVYVGDVGDAFVRALDSADTAGSRLELCGPDEYSLEEIVRDTARMMGIRRLIVPLGDAASRLMANVLQFAPGKPMTPDNYGSLQIPSVCRENGFAPFHITPKSVESIMPLNLQGRGQRRRYMDHRRTAGRDTR